MDNIFREIRDNSIREAYFDALKSLRKSMPYISTEEIIQEVMKKEAFEGGKAAGIAQGEASGRAEREREMAKALKVKGVSIDIIAETSGLTVEEIEKL